MKAIKCNRCGNYQNTVSEYPGEQKMRSIIKILMPGEFPSNKMQTKYIDLDEECTRELLNFVEENFNEEIQK